MRFRSFLAALSASACLAVQVFAYEPGTHREIAERATLPEQSSLDSVLRARNEISVPDEGGLAVNVFHGWWPRRQFDDGSG